jgi:hypothetical protein
MKSLLALAILTTVVLAGCIGARAEPLPRGWVAGDEGSCYQYGEYIYRAKPDIALLDAYYCCMRGQAAAPSCGTPLPPNPNRRQAPYVANSPDDVCAAADRYARSLGQQPDPRPCTPMGICPLHWEQDAQGNSYSTTKCRSGEQPTRYIPSYPAPSPPRQAAPKPPTAPVPVPSTPVPSPPRATPAQPSASPTDDACRKYPNLC